MDFVGKKEHEFVAHVSMTRCWESFQCSNPGKCLVCLCVLLGVFQYNYMGSDPNAATQKIIQAFNLINNVSSEVWFYTLV